MPAGAPSANQYLKAGASTPGNLEWENPLAITTVQTAANESAMLGLTTQEGDVVIRTDESKTYIKNSGTAGSMADFTHLVSPTGTVTTVDGHSGTVTANDIRDAVESATDSNTFTDAESSKLAGIATSANNYTHPNHTGEVTSSADGAQTIASNVVDEDNLKISNAGTNGQFLQKQSGNTGGLTWETVDLTNLSASNLTSGTIPDARFPSTLPAVSGANLTNLPAPQLTGTLPAISGANLTNLPAGGNSVTLTASGAIAAGKPCIIKTDGKAQQVQTVGVNYGPSNVQSASQVSSHTNMKSVQVAQNQQYPDWRVGICGFETAGNSAYIQYSTYNAVTGNNAPSSEPQWTWSSDGLYNNTHISCHKFMPGRNFFITGTNASSNQSGTIGASQLFTCSQASNGDITKKQIFILIGKRVLDLEPIGTVSGAYTFLALVTDNSSIYVQQFTVNSSGYITAGTAHSMSTTNGYAEAENGKFAWNSDYTRGGVAWLRQSD